MSQGKSWPQSNQSRGLKLFFLPSSNTVLPISADKLLPSVLRTYSSGWRRGSDSLSSQDTDHS